MKSEKLRTKKVEKSLTFHVFWCFVRYEILTQDMKTSLKKLFPLLRRHFISVLSTEKKNVKKKNEKWKVANQKSRKIVNFSFFWCFVRYEILTQDMKTSEKNMFSFLRRHFISVLSIEERNVEKNENWKVANQKSQKSLNFSYFCVLKGTNFRL